MDFDEDMRFKQVEPDVQLCGVKAMNQKTQNIKGIRWDYWIKFSLTFLVGIGLVIAFSVLVTLGNPQALKSFPDFGEAYPLYLCLTLAGALGGILYSILLDGSLELPTWGEGGNSMNVGSIGEVFVGIGGAFIAYVVLPEALKPSIGEAATQAEVANFNSLLIFVTGLVGGYGGKAVMNTALSRIIGQVKEVKQVEQPNEEQSLESPMTTVEIIHDTSQNETSYKSETS